MRRCTSCKQEKPLGAFRRDGRAIAKDRLTWWCSACLTAAGKACRERKLAHYREVNRTRHYERAGRPVEPLSLRRWTDAEDTVLIEKWGRSTMCRRDIARTLDRTVGACERRAWLLGLKLTGEDWRLVEVGLEAAA